MILYHSLLCPSALFGCSVLAAIADVRERRIPNKLVSSVFVCGIMLHLGFGGAAQAACSALAALIGGGAFMIFYLAGGMGAGDVKLIAALSAVAGISNVKDLLIATVLAGAACALVFAIWRGALRSTLANVIVLLMHHGKHGFTAHPRLNVSNTSTHRLPYAVPTAVACGWLLSMQCVARAVR
ncbi:MAG TPA: A24 family peptidase [Acidobacteriaceae bacterium]|nr:A24 family peptidase [Acidobacteriaceae bacterium]